VLKHQNFIKISTNDKTWVYGCDPKLSSIHHNGNPLACHRKKREHGKTKVMLIVLFGYVCAEISQQCSELYSHKTGNLASGKFAITLYLPTQSSLCSGL
jgi:hypothetical protein